MRKRSISVILCALLLLPSLSLLGGCGAQSASVLRVYNWEEYIDEGGEGSYDYDYEIDENAPSMIDRFEDWYEETYGEKIRVEYSTFGTNEDLYNQLKLGNRYDLVCPSDYMIMKLAAENMLEPLDESFFEDSEENYYVNNVSPYIANVFENGTMQIDGETHRWDEYAAGYMWGTTGLVYNPDLVSEEDLAQGWEILLDSKFKQKVTTKDNVRDTYFIGLAICYQEELLALKEQYENKEISAETYNAAVTEIMNRTDEKSAADVQKILLDMKENIFGFETDTGKSDMVKGTILLNFAWSGDAVYAIDLAEEEEKYFNYYIPEEGSNLWFDGWVMPKGANKQAAQAFINFLSMPENAVRNMYYIGYSSVIAGEEVFDYVLDTYGVEEGDEEEAVEYDLSYFFGEGHSVSTYEDQLYRQLYAQYPREEVTYHCAVMDYYGEDDARINELWTKIKGETLDAWAIAVICVAVVLITLFVIFVKLGGKIDLFRPKPKKGYTRIKQEPVK